MMKNKGFTLLESIMSVAIMVAIVFAATLLAKDVLSTNQSAVQSLSAQSDTRRAIKSWIAELRTATPSLLIWIATIDQRELDTSLAHPLDRSTEVWSHQQVVHHRMFCQEKV